MLSKLLPPFLSLFLLLLSGCSDESTNQEISTVELAQAPEIRSTEETDPDPVEGVDFPVVQEIYVYEQEGRRDPFSPLLKEGADSQEEGQISVENLSLVGVIWGDTRKVAVLSDQAGNGYVFKVGDALPSGRVVSISDKSIVFELSQFGIVTKYEIVMEE